MDDFALGVTLDCLYHHYQILNLKPKFGVRDSDAVYNALVLFQQGECLNTTEGDRHSVRRIC